MLALTLDPDGRRVGLSEGTWSHIKTAHPVLAPHIRDVMRAVREPDRRLQGRKADEEFFYLAESGPGHWLKVVVHYEEDEGVVVTAFPRRDVP